MVQAEEDRKAAAKALLEEVSQSNKRLEERKLEMKQAEVEEDLRIAEYLRLKEAREQVSDSVSWSVGLAGSSSGQWWQSLWEGSPGHVHNKAFILLS